MPETVNVESTPNHPLRDPIRNQVALVGKRIYFKEKFFYNQLRTDIVVDLPGYPTLSKPYAANRFIFMELLSRSPYLFNFLSMKNQSMRDFIETVAMEETTDDKLHYHIDGKLLFIKVPAKFHMSCIDLLERRANRGEIYLEEQDTKYYMQHVVYPIAKRDNLKGSELHRKLFEHLQEETFTLDFALADIPEFDELDQELKARIINFEFLRADSNKKQAEQGIEKFVERLKSRTVDLYQNRMHEYNQRITNIHHELNKIRQAKREETALYNHTMMDDSKLNPEKLKRVMANPLVDRYRIKDNLVEIYTKPIVLNMSPDKYRAITLQKKRTKLQEGYSLGLGRHLIKINLKDFTIQYQTVDGYRNHHIERYSCYGTFLNKIEEAQENRNLAQLIALAIQMLSQATIGDPAGYDTIKEAYLLTPDNLVEYDKKVYPVMDFLSNVKMYNDLGDIAYED